MWNRMSREKKKTADLQNRLLVAKKQRTDSQARKDKLDFEAGGEEPFYERLIKTDNEYQSRKRQLQIQTRQNRANAASFKDGKCFLDLMKYTDHAKQDEIKANEIADRINKRHDREVANRKKQKQNKLMNTSLSNYQKVQMADKTQVAQLRSREQAHPGKSNDIYATIRVREIAEGMSPEDKIQLGKMRASEYKKELDELYGGEEAPVRELPTAFLGMTDDEVIVNKELFKELGLL